MGFLDNVKDALKDAVTSRASKDEAAREKAANEKAAQEEAAERDDVVVDRADAPPAPPSIPIDSADAGPTVEPTSEPTSEQREDAREAKEAKLETYTVKVGDSLPEIGTRFGVSHLEIAKLNSIENPDLIFPGQVFRIPRR